jgi:hypothetical protein
MNVDLRLKKMKAQGLHLIANPSKIPNKGNLNLKDIKFTMC